MNFGAAKNDEDRLVKAHAEQSLRDHSPSIPEWQAWSMRPRNKSKEIGPSMKYNSHFQNERLMDSIKSTTQAFFSTMEVTKGRGRSPIEIDSKIKKYIKTGQYEIPDTEVTHENASINTNLMGVAGFSKLRKAQENTKQETMHRSSKLQRTNYLV